MKRFKETFVLGFAIFASFFGAGNLILPPMLGFNSGSDWWLVAMGFLLSATLIPLLALFGHARLQGTMIDFAEKVSTRFALLFCICVYVMVIILPCPRTAAVTHEISIQPYFGTSALLTSSVYFFLVFLFAVNRGVVIDILGKYLTPIIGLILLAIIGLGVIGPSGLSQPGIYKAPMVSGFLEGYQTYDAIAGLVVGGIIVITVNNAHAKMSSRDKNLLIGQSGLVAILGLFIIYIGLIYVGSKYKAEFGIDISRADLLSGLSRLTLGNTGTAFLSVLVALSCFTTAVSIVIGTADFFKGILGNSKKVYVITTLIACLTGIFMGQFEVKFIIDLAVYVLMFLYPVSIVLILLNICPDKYAGRAVFRTVVSLALLFSIPDFLKQIIPVEHLELIYRIVPFSREALGWVIPSLLGFLVANMIVRFRNPSVSA